MSLEPTETRLPLSGRLRWPWRRAAARRAERETLGFVRQPEVKWLSPSLLVRAGVEVAVSAAFGKFADKREIELAKQLDFDYSGHRELWLDFLSDTGDGWAATSTMAWCLAQPQLSLRDGNVLPRAHVLVLGGDEVYPSAGRTAYEDRFVGPFETALPRVDDEARAPHMYAVPGNHDWYDGLTSFMRLFCQRGWIGGWRRRQRRSYFALRLPHRWWLWAIDIQLDTYLDDPQLKYFEKVGAELTAGDKVVLVTAKPSWTKVRAGEPDPPSWKNLAFFERRITDKEAHLALVLTGDLHHYSRYEPAEGADGPARVTAGGGGAYLSGTHTLPSPLPLRPHNERDPVAYELRTEYPRAPESKRFRRGVFLLPATTPSFGFLTAGIYALLAATMLGELGRAGRAAASFVELLEAAVSGSALLVFALLVAALFAYTDLHPVSRVVVAALQSLAHLALVAALVSGSVTLLGLPSGTVGSWLVGLAGAAIGGFVGGALVFAFFLWAIHVVRRDRAPRAANEVFAAQGIVDYKNFLRMRIDAQGGLTVYPLGVDKVPRRWEVVDRDGRPHSRPVDGPPAVRLIDRVLAFGAEPAGTTDEEAVTAPASPTRSGRPPRRW